MNSTDPLEIHPLLQGYGHRCVGMPENEWITWHTDDPHMTLHMIPDNAAAQGYSVGRAAGKGWRAKWRAQSVSECPYCSEPMPPDYAAGATRMRFHRVSIESALGFPPGCAITGAEWNAAEEEVAFHVEGPGVPDCDQVAIVERPSVLKEIRPYRKEDQGN